MPAQPQKRLLFVDDEPAIRATLPVILRRYGFTVTTAASTDEALDLINKQTFDLLLCDLNIQREGDGYTIVSAARTVNPRCVTIVLTGYPNLQSAVEGIRHGVDDYIVKPSNADALVALLAEKLAAKQPKARILSVSYDEVLMRTRQMLLETQGYEVVSSTGFESSLQHCRDGGFDLFILGHSVPREDKRRIVEAFREACAAPIISLRRNAGEEPVEGADFDIEPDPEPLLKLIANIVQRKPAQHQMANEARQS
jgi:DNA-binding response OmpR family regulator